MNKMNKNMNSIWLARTLDLFVGDSGEELTGKELKRSMKEVDAALLLRRRRVSSPAMMVAAVRSRFACGSAFASEEDEGEAMEQKRLPLGGAAKFMGPGR